MNFNIGGFSEGLKHSYQQFCKQDAESREHSRRLLVKLKKFEAKSFDLIAQTQTAQQMRNQYERMLMQQNPLLWAQLQRNITMDVTDCAELGPQLSVHSGLKFTKEMAINTSPNSSTSEQHSLHEEGVWPHTPSPYPEIDMHQQLSTNKDTNNLSESNIGGSKTVDKASKNSSYSEEQLHKRIPPGSPVQESVKVKYFQQPSSNFHLPHNHFTSVLQTDDFIPASSSTPNFMPLQDRHVYSRSTHLESEVNISSVRKESTGDVNQLATGADDKEQLEVSVTRPTAKEVEDLTNKVEEISVTDLNVPESPRAAYNPQNITQLTTYPDDPTSEVQQNIPVKQNDKIKPFRLDSESDGAEDPSISGPLSGKNVGGDDSDSFWN